MGTSYGSTHTRAKAEAEYIMKLKSDVASNETFEWEGGLGELDCKLACESPFKLIVFKGQAIRLNCQLTQNMPPRSIRNLLPEIGNIIHYTVGQSTGFSMFQHWKKRGKETGYIGIAGATRPSWKHYQ